VKPPGAPLVGAAGCANDSANSQELLTRHYDRVSCLTSRQIALGIKRSDTQGGLICSREIHTAHTWTAFVVNIGPEDSVGPFDEASEAPTPEMPLISLHRGINGDFAGSRQTGPALRSFCVSCTQRMECSRRKDDISC
jgi:hypothetical protein